MVRVFTSNDYDVYNLRFFVVFMNKEFPLFLQGHNLIIQLKINISAKLVS